MGCPQAFSRLNSPSSQTLFVCQILQSNHHLCSPNQTCSSLSMFLILENPKLCTALQIQSYWSCTGAKDHLPQSASNAVQDAVSLLTTTRM